jgi:hypothetical protein
MCSLGKLEQPFVASKEPHLNRSYFMDRELKRVRTDRLWLELVWLGG